MPMPVASIASLEVAARFTRETGLASWVVVKRQPRVVAQAQDVADQLGLRLVVEIHAATIALRFARQPSERRKVWRFGF
jgi:aspartate aminotransferase-like enzyme